MLADERTEQLTQLELRLGYRFTRLELLNQALTHKSFVHERSACTQHNERMEFLGDAVLELVVSDYCFTRFAGSAEGELSKLRAALVNEGNLARIARRLDLGHYLLLGRGEEHTRGRDKPSLLADTLEAIIAAVYLDGTLEDVYQVVVRCFQEELQTILNDGHMDYKSELQEYTQEKFGCVPLYTVLREHGPDHEKVFEVQLAIRSHVQGVGVGKSKKEAEQAAARQVLDHFKQQETMAGLPEEPTDENPPCPLS
ncbi:MAG: ribonuclease III [Nitrospinae bacterium]|nr:ribonuclease III [Nitrospinota bacterium]